MGQFSKDGKYCSNTAGDIRKACSEKGWNGYDAEPIPEKVLEYAEKFQEADVLPEGFEMFPCADGSVQFEYPDEDAEDFDIFEIYDGRFVHSYKDGYRGFYEWMDFLNYAGALKLKLRYLAKEIDKRIT